MLHIIKSQQFDKPGLEKLFRRTDQIIDDFADPIRRRALDKYPGRILSAIFYEPSTRTRFSFTHAAMHLGLHVSTTENAAEFSSAIKGETLEDTIEVICRYRPDIIVLRHPETGAAERAVMVADRHQVSIINAGDGEGQHPTQALTDLYTIHRELKRLDHLTVAIGGDLARGRTARSLVYLLSKYRQAKFIFIASPDRQMRADILEHLDYQEQRYELSATLDPIKEADVVYWTRTQKERGSSGPSLIIDQAEVEQMKPEAILLHPLPRIDEIAQAVDSDPRAKYFDQAEYGMFVRMSLIEQIFSQ